MQSKITGGATTHLFTTKVLNKFDVKYYRCNDTGFVQTEDPYWLDEAYNSAITQLDIGLPYRNLKLADAVGKVLATHFDKKGYYLDYAGGYGLFTRLMRDKGFNYFTTDKFCENIFAKFFDLTDLVSNSTFEVVTAFEVFEHLQDPISGIQEMLIYGDTLIFTTELQPKDKDLIDWHYLSAETGQHIAFYNEEALQSLASRLKYNFYSDGNFLHMFTKKSFGSNPLIEPQESFLLRKARRMVDKANRLIYKDMESLLMKDFYYIKNELTQH